MSLQMIIGCDGSGRLETVYQKLIQESMAHPDQKFYLIVPEQYTMQTQIKMTQLHPGHGVMNIDVVSFPRLAYRIFDELGEIQKTILEDTGKSMVIRRLLSDHKGEFQAFSRSLRKSGFVGQAKSMLSELFQYGVGSDALEKSMDMIGKDTILGKKLRDIQILYHAFKEYMADTYMTAEELLDVLSVKLPDSELMKDSVVYIENFTGFTPSQYKILEQLLRICKKVTIGLCIDIHEKPYDLGEEYQLFYITKETLYKIKKMCIRLKIEEEEDILLDYIESKDMNLQEQSFLEKHLFHFHRFKPWMEKPEHIKLYTLDHPMDELRFVASDIQRQVMEQGKSYSDFALITGDVGRYRENALHIFSKVGIPLFIDDKTDISEHSFVQMIKSGLEILWKDFSYESIFMYLRCGYTQVAEEDIDFFENYMLATGIRGKKKWISNFIKNHSNFEPTDYLRVNDIRKQILEELAPLMVLESQNSVSAYAQGVRQFIGGLKGEERLNDYVEQFNAQGEFVYAQEYGQIYDEVIDLLDKCEQILTDVTVSLKEFMEILDAGFSEIQIAAIPPTLDQVVLGDLKRTRLGNVETVYMIGCNDGVIPTPVSAHGILSDSEKELLKDCPIELAPTGRQNAFRERFYIYSAMIKPKTDLILTYALADSQGKSMRPSMILKDLMYLFPNLSEEIPPLSSSGYVLSSFEESSLFLIEGMHDQSKRNDLWKALYAWFHQQETYKNTLEHWKKNYAHDYSKSPLSNHIVEALYGARPIAGITALEKYAACAYAHFLSRGLHLEGRKEARLLPPDMGVILHEAMERFSNQVKDSDYTWKNIPDAVREDWIETCVREVGMEYGSAIFLENARHGYYLNKLVRIAKRSAWTIQEQIRKGEFEPVGFETKFFWEDQVNFTGVIDRYDIYEDDEICALRIIDYKTGEKGFDLTEIYYGLSLQLVVYLEYLTEIESKKHKDKIMVKAGMFYYPMNDPISDTTSTDPYTNAVNQVSALKMKGLVCSDGDIVKKMDQNLSEPPSIIPVSLTKNGEFSKTSNIATGEDFDALGLLVRKRIKMLADQWMSGKIPVNPYLYQKGSKKRTACDYCPYKGICRFDEYLKGCSYHRLKEISSEDIWEHIYEEVKGEWENPGQKNSSKS